MHLPTYIQDLLLRLEARGFQAFVVGGCVRDYLLGLTPEDWDICTSAKPDEMLQVFQDFTVIPTGIQHGTVTVVCQDGHAEITTFRTDGIYTDSRHPKSVTFVPDIYEDLARRDFTVNAMAYAPKHGLVDPYGGKEDLKRKILRCVGEADKRLYEDALRILRALRFSAVHDLEIESKTSAAMLRNQDGLTCIARERIWSELKKMLHARRPGKVLLHYPEILSVIFQTDRFRSMLYEDWCKLMEYLDFLPPCGSMRLAGLLYPHLEHYELCAKIVQGLKPDNKTKQQVLTYLSLSDKPLPSTLADARHLTGKLGMKMLDDFITWKAGQAVFLSKEYAEQLKKNVELSKQFLHTIRTEKLCCSVSELAINGSDLLAAGILSGKELGALLQEALHAVIDEQIPNEKKAIMNHLFL